MIVSGNVLRAEGNGSDRQSLSVRQHARVKLASWSNQAASIGKGKGLVHSKHRVRVMASLTVLNTSF